MGTSAQTCQIHLEVLYPATAGRLSNTGQHPHRMNLRRVLSIIVAVLLVATLGWLHYELLTETYGSGPPHYGQTTNMDKWSSPGQDC